MSEAVNLKAFYNLTYGLYLVTSRDGEKLNGLIVNTVVQVAQDPLLITVAINKSSFTGEIIRRSGIFAVSVLNINTPMDFIGRFGFKSGRDFDKFKGVQVSKGITGAPIVMEHALSTFEARVKETVDCGSHTLFIAEVVSAIQCMDGEPLTYSYYHKIKGGKTGKGAPLYKVQQSEKLNNIKGNETMQKYVCKICGYVYDPQKGDPDSNISAGTPFEKLPDDWVCPVCGASKKDFEPLN